MDYIREELLRQRTALLALLTGGTAAETAEEAHTAWGKETAPGEETETGAPAEREPVWAAEDAAGAAERSGTEWLRVVPSDGETAERGRAGLAGTRSPAAGTVRRLPLWAPEAASEESLREAAAAAGEGTWGPKALSRAFQRDARRYDGGFSLY